MASVNGYAGFPAQEKKVVDLTPISERTQKYWADQGYVLADVQDDPQYVEEIEQANLEQIAKGQRPYDPEKFGPIDPAHPYAYTPRYVTFKMRRDQGFRCFVMDWKEDDWILNKNTGELRLVGKLTRDHTKAATLGGETSAHNLKMVSALVNRKKGAKLITYIDLRAHMDNYWHVLEMYGPVKDITLDQLQKIGVKYVTF